MKKSFAGLGLAVLMAFVAVFANAANKVPLKPDGSRVAPATVFGYPYNCMSIGTTSACTSRLTVFGDIYSTGTILYNAAIDAGGVPSLANGAYIGTDPSVSTFTSAGVAQLQSATIAGSATVGTTLGVTGAATLAANLYIAPATAYTSTFTASNGNADIGGAFSSVGSATIGGSLNPKQLSSAAINALTGAVGRVYVCSDCTNTYTLCVSTGTGANQYREVGAATACK